MSKIQLLIMQLLAWAHQRSAYVQVSLLYLLSILYITYILPLIQCILQWKVG